MRLWQQKTLFDPSFPFLVEDSHIPAPGSRLHWHEYPELLCVLKGKLCATIDDREWEAEEGDIIMLDGAISHKFVSKCADTTVRYYQYDPLVMFGENMFKPGGKTFLDPGFSMKPVLKARSGGPFYDHINACLQAIYREHREKDAGYQLIIKARLCELVVAAMREMPDTQPYRAALKDENRRLEMAVSFMKRNFSDPCLSLEATAKEAAFSKFHFARFFHERTGRTFLNFL
jgi:hypothetical protein